MFGEHSANLQQIAAESSVEELLAAEAALGKRDLYYFTTQVLRVQDDSPITRPQGEIEPITKWLSKPRPAHLQAHSRWKRFLALPRGTGKTTLVSAYVAWRIVRNPNIAVYYTSEEKALALDITDTIAKMLENERVVALYGPMRGDRDWRQGKITITQRTAVRKDSTLMAGGVDVSAQGRHPDLIIADDLQGKTNITPEGIEKVKEYLRLMWPVLNPGGELVYICTRWDWADAAQAILEEWRKDPSSWDLPGLSGYFGATAKVGDEDFFPHAVPDEPLFPSILPQEELDSLKHSMNIYHYSCQYENDPVPSEAQYFSQADFQHVHNYDPNDVIFQGLTYYMGVDPAGGVATQKGDDTAIVVIGVKGERSKRQHYVVDMAGGQWNPSRINETIQALYEKWRPRRIGIESAGPGKMFYAQLREWMKNEMIYMPLLELKRGGATRESKADRIGTLEPLYRAHSVFHTEAIKGSKLEVQLLRFAPGGAVHDDYPDALAMAVECIREGQLRQAPKSLLGNDFKPRYSRMGY